MTATSTVSPDGDWMLVGSAYDATVRWAPDGRHLLLVLATTNAPLDQQRVVLVSAAGEPLRTYQADAAYWIDEEHFAVFGFPRLPTGEVRFPLADTGAMGTLESDQLIAVDIPSDGVPNGHGLVAYGLGEGPREQFQVWSLDGRSEPREGAPDSWSVDGRLLVVWHYLDGSGPRSSGWLEVINWATGETLLSDPQVRTGIGGSLLDPLGGRLAYLDGRNKVVDLARGAVSTIEQDDFSMWRAWNAGGNLIIATLDGDAMSFASDGTPIRQWPGVGDGITGSQDGAVIGFWFSEAPHATNTLTIVRNGAARAIPMPESDCRSAVLAPDGRRVVVICWGNNNQRVYIRSTT